LKTNKRVLTSLYVFVIFLLGSSLLFAFSIGAVKIELKEIVNILLGNHSTENSEILLGIRLPRVMLAAILGAGLSVVGAVLQGVFKNPLVDSYTLGMSSGAALGAVFAIITGLSLTFFGISIIGIFAFIGAILTLLLVFALSSTGGKVAMDSLLLAGVATSYFLASIISFMMLLNKDRIEQVIFWTMGSLSLSTWSKLNFSLIIIIPSIIILNLFTRELNVLVLGDENASYIGINVAKSKAIMLVLSALIVATVVSAGGTIAFLGLICPHIIRFMGINDNKHLVPLSALLGAATLVIADLLGRTLISPMEIPVGIMTSLLGGPFFIYLLRKRRM